MQGIWMKQLASIATSLGPDISPHSTRPAWCFSISPAPASSSKKLGQNPPSTSRSTTLKPPMPNCDRKESNSRPDRTLFTKTRKGFSASRERKNGWHSFQIPRTTLSHLFPERGHHDSEMDFDSCRLHFLGRALRRRITVCFAWHVYRECRFFFRRCQIPGIHVGGAPDCDRCHHRIFTCQKIARHARSIVACLLSDEHSGCGYRNMDG